MLCKHEILIYCYRLNAYFINAHFFLTSYLNRFQVNKIQHSKKALSKVFLPSYKVFISENTDSDTFSALMMVIFIL